jgi:hypothetical protein
VDTILKQNGDKLFEYQMAIRRDKSPCGWFDNDVWLRSIADVLVIDDPTAFVFDWKTGKVRENPTQLKLFAAMVMSHLPVNTVKTCYVWLQYEQVTMDTYHRADLPADMEFARTQTRLRAGHHRTRRVQAKPAVVSVVPR